MARVPRAEAAGAIHHVIPAGNNGGRIVEDDRDRASYLARFARIRRELGWLCHASCLMDTHHHAVVETPMPNLGLGMRRLLGGHSHWFNLRHGQTGSVFVPHFWSRRLADEAWFSSAPACTPCSIRWLPVCARTPASGAGARTARRPRVILLRLLLARNVS